MQALRTHLVHALALYVIVATVMISLASAQSTTVPLQLQATILQKIFSYNRTLEHRTPKVLIVAADANDPQVSELKATLKRLGSTVDVTSAVALPTQVDGASAVYIMPGQLTDAVSRTCAQHGILSVSGVPAWAEQGRVSVAIGLADGKPEIIVSLQRSKAERHDLSSRLLRLARVIP
jgi:hypothetical protein